MEAVDRTDANKNLQEYEKLYNKMMEFIYYDPEAFQQPLARRVREKYLEAARMKCGRALRKAEKDRNDDKLRKLLAKAAEHEMDGNLLSLELASHPGQALVPTLQGRHGKAGQQRWHLWHLKIGRLGMTQLAE